MIRKAVPGDIEVLMTIYHHAQDEMIRNGNPSQWGHRTPSRDMIMEDIGNGDLYAVTDDHGSVHAVFAMLFGEDPTYRVIEDGSWLNDEPYVTIHRIASDGKMHGILETAVTYALTFAANVRIDTHKDNHIMHKLLKRLGFKRCGIIYIRDGSPRTAYQLVLRRLSEG